MFPCPSFYLLSYAPYYYIIILVISLVYSLTMSFRLLLFIYALSLVLYPFDLFSFELHYALHVPVVH